MWNEHKIQIKGGRRRSPWEIFFTSLLQDGPCGLRLDTANQTAFEGGSFLDHSATTNPLLTGPSSFSHVDIEAPGCPLSGDELQELDSWLQARDDESIRCMTYQKSVWIDALDFCSRLRDDDSA